VLKHIVLWKLKDEAAGASKAENAVEMKKRLDALVGVVPGPVEFEVGINIDPEGGVSDIALYSVFESREALKAYAVHPKHVEAGVFIKQVAEERRCVDYEF